MPIVFTLPPPGQNVWYLAYGSNMSTEKFIKDRGIYPLRTAVVTVPRWTLSMDSAGVPYSEPSYGSISPMQHEKDGVQLMGVAYQLTPEKYTKVLSSEGGGIAYAEIEVRAKMMDIVQDDHPSSHDGTIAVRSLTTVMRREARPSIRYMGLLRTGADKAELPSSYQIFLAGIPVYSPPTRLFFRLGAVLFLLFWTPVMTVAEILTKESLKRSQTGNAPAWVIVLVRTVVRVMWLYHDYIHAPVWGRGDGMDGISRY